jgi:hypothetical protein
MLGGGRNLAAAAPQIDEARRLALGVEAPLYRVGGHWRTTLLIGNTTPATCTLVEQGPPLLLPETVARSAGLAAEKGLPRRSFQAADGRQFEVQVVHLKQIRLGVQEISHVEAYILPPEAEDLGVVLNRRYIGGYRLEPQPRRLRLAVQPGG